MTALVHRLSARGPDDTAPLDNAIAAGRIDPAGIVAILGKTEGNGCVNDFTRAFAVKELHDALARYLAPAALDRVSLVMSGGTEGGLAPHWLVLERRDATTGSGPALAIGSAHTPTSRRSISAGGRRWRWSPTACAPPWPTPASTIPPMCISSRSSARC